MIDRYELPIGGLQNEFGADLDGDQIIDNQLGRVVTPLDVAGDDLTTHSADMIASGVLGGTIEIVANDLDDDATVGLTYLGAEGDPATIVGGRFVDGAFLGNPTATTRHPGAARIHLPVFADADPIIVDAIGVSLDMIPDGDGYIGIVRGGLRDASARDAAFAGMTQMILANPRGHLPFSRLLDTDGDGALTRPEFDANDLVSSLLVSDIVLDGEPVLSFGFRIHLAPCATGRCAAPPLEPCFDRARAPTEADVDCGGSCALACPTGATCSVAADCQSRGCAGTCAAPTCTDGVADGLESDVDCGANCAPCATGQICAGDADCASRDCSSGLGTSGACR